MKSLTKYTMIAAISLSGLIGIARADTAAAAPSEVKAPEAQPPVTPVGEDKWKLTVPLYIWLAGLDGTVSGGGRTAIDLSASDVMQHTDLGLVGYIQIAKPEDGAYVSPLYMKLSDDGKAGAVKASASLELWIVEFAALYRIWHPDTEHPISLSALAGGRYYSLHSSLTLKDPLGNANFTQSKSLCDPIIGLRYEQYFTKRFHAWVQGDIGGFDISENQTKFSWQVQPLLGYDFEMIVIHKPSTVFAGYRVLGIQQSEGSGANERGYNLRLQGVVFGLCVFL